MLRIAICDDQIEHAHAIEHKLMEISDPPNVITCFEKPEQFLMALERDGGAFDALLLDIMLGEQSGIDFGNTIRRHYPNLCLVYITGYIEYSQEVFESEPCYFLVKPIIMERLERALHAIRKKLSQQSNAFLMLKCNGEIVRIPVKDISYIESGGRAVQIHEIDSARSFYAKLDDLQVQLPGTFIRCHKSFLVNPNYIKSLQNDMLVLYSGKELPISQNKRKFTREKFLRHIETNL